MRVKEIHNRNLKRIHINRHTMNKNRKHGLDDTPIGIEQSGQPKVYAQRVWILGPCAINHNPEKPLKCGAKVWIETKAPIDYITHPEPETDVSEDECELLQV